MVDAAQVVHEVAQAPAEAKKALKVEQSMFIGEVQLLLAEKRTAYALLRTGVTVSLVPLSVWTALIATSRLWNPFAVWWLLAIVMLFTGSLLVLGVWLITHALHHASHADAAIGKLREGDTVLERLLLEERRLWHRRRRAQPAA